MPVSSCSLTSNSRICACIVTSRAVVGSSAIRSLGLQAIAMAIITRWFMPPESWCGNAESRCSGEGMPTSARSSAARRRLCALSMSRWAFKASISWKPTVKQGLRLDIGSWKIIAMSLPMILRRWRDERSSRLWPSKLILSAVTFAVQGSSPITASMATDLPDPDSPTIASTSPLSTLSDTPSTARKKPDAVLNSTVRFSISSIAMGISFSSSAGRARHADHRPSG